MGLLNEYVGSGLWDGGRCVFRNPQFGRLPDYRDGQVVVFTADLYLPDDDGQVLEGQRFSMGNGWVASDDGTEIVAHEDGKKLKLNDGTGLGHFVNTLGVVEGLDDVLTARIKNGDPGVTPFHVGLYDGLDVTVEQKSKDMTINGDQVTQRWYEVVEFHGYEGQGSSSNGNGKAAKKAAAPVAKKATKAVAKKAAAKKVEEPAEDNPTDGVGAVDEKVVAKIIAIANECETFDDFVARSYAEVDEVADAPYSEMVEDTSDDGLWAQVCAAYAAAEG